MSVLLSPLSYEPVTDESVVLTTEERYRLTYKFRQLVFTFVYYYTNVLPEGFDPPTLRLRGDSSNQAELWKQNCEFRSAVHIRRLRPSLDSLPLLDGLVDLNSRRKHQSYLKYTLV